MNMQLQKLSITFAILACMVWFNLNAQNVAINTTGLPADASSMLDVSSTNTGLLVPRVSLSMTTTAAPVTAPANSLLVYNIATAGDVTPGYYYWNSTLAAWVRLATGTGWLITGNTGTVSGTNFMGSIDNVSVDFRTNNTIRATLMNTGELRMTGLGTAASPVISWTGDPNTGIYRIGADNLALSTNGIERFQLSTTSAVFNDPGNDYDFRIESDLMTNAFFVDASLNNIGLNTATPGNQLHFESDGRAGWVTLWNNTSANGGLKQIYNNSTANGSRVLMGVTNYNASALVASAVMGLSLNTTATGAGGVGVTGSANNESGNAVEGTLFFTGAYTGWAGYFNADVFSGGTYFGSDRRLKRDIKPINNALNLISRIDPVSYYYDTDKYPGIGFDEDRLSYGFIAQDVEKIIPEMVKDKNIVLNANTEKTPESISNREMETFKVVNYSLMIPILTQAIKEQQVIIEDLRARIEELEKKK